jgi:hypothetical protein
MAATKSLIFTGVQVNTTDYTLHLAEGAEVSIEEVVDQVDDGQTLVSAYDVSFSVDVYDDAPLSDSNVNTNTAVAPVKSNITFSGAPGSATLLVTNVIVNGVRNYENNRSAIRLTGSKRTTSLTEAVTES